MIVVGFLPWQNRHHRGQDDEQPMNGGCKTAKYHPIARRQSEAIHAHRIIDDGEQVERTQTEYYGQDMDHSLWNENKVLVIHTRHWHSLTVVTQERISIAPCNKFAYKQQAVIVAPNSQMPMSEPLYAYNEKKNTIRLW